MKKSIPSYGVNNSITCGISDKLSRSNSDDVNPNYGYGIRHVQIVLMFLCEVITFGIRMNLPISIVAMTNPRENENPSIPTYHWTDTSTILSSYLWGFVLTELFGGYLAQRFGFKWFLVISMAVSSTFSYFLPALTAEFGDYGTMFCRMMEGFCQGIMYPMVSNFLSKWVPERERSYYTTVVYAGGDLGTVIVTGLAGYCASSWVGWPFTFRLYGIIGMLWAISFALLGSNSPETHCSISEEEVLYIMRGRKSSRLTKNTPWKQIFTSVPVWSLWFCTVSSYWGYWVLSMEVPTFLSDVLGFNITSDSLLMTLVYLASWLVSFLAGGCTQFIINREITTVCRTRKILNSIAFYIPAICVAAIGIIQGANKSLCLAFLVFAIIVDSFGYCSYYPNYIDISPHYCGTLFGVGQWIATIFTIFCPWLNNKVLQTHQAHSSAWENLFLYTAAMYAVSNTLFIICGTGQVQEWDHYDTDVEGFGKRHVQFLLLYFGGFIAFDVRSSLSVAIVAMISTQPPHPYIKTYPEWNNKDIILSSFFWGGVISESVAGYIADKYRPKHVLGTAFAVASIFTLLVPLMADTFGSAGVILSRVLQGVSQGFLIPFTHSILSKWTPFPERSRVIGFVYSAPNLGMTISMSATGLICNSSYGWPMVFYITGILGLLWSIFYLWLASTEPEAHKTISSEEKEYIEQNIKIKSARNNTLTPWLAIFTTPGVWAIIIVFMAVSYGFGILLTETPSYMYGVLDFDISENGFLSALPFLMAFVFSMILSVVSDAMISRAILTLVNVRKFFVAIGTYGSATALICLVYVPQSMKWVPVFLLVAAGALDSSSSIGFMSNFLDIAPNFAGLLLGISSSIGHFCSMIGPLVVQITVLDEKDSTHWRLSFLIAAAVYILGGTFFLFFASDEVQQWNEGDENSAKMKAIEGNEEKLKAYNKQRV